MAPDEHPGRERPCRCRQCRGLGGKSMLLRRTLLARPSLLRASQARICPGAVELERKIGGTMEGGRNENGAAGRSLVQTGTAEAQLAREPAHRQAFQPLPAPTGAAPF